MDFTWLKRLLLPFEFEDHPLHTPPPYKPEEDSDWDDLGESDDEPNTYSRIAFYRAPQWERWGDKWYKKH
jgi:hypothetical protein